MLILILLFWIVLPFLYKTINSTRISKSSYVGSGLVVYIVVSVLSIFISDNTFIRLLMAASSIIAHNFIMRIVADCIENDIPVAKKLNKKEQNKVDIDSNEIAQSPDDWIILTTFNSSHQHAIYLKIRSILEENKIRFKFSNGPLSILYIHPDDAEKAEELCHDLIEVINRLSNSV